MQASTHELLITQIIWCRTYVQKHALACDTKAGTLPPLRRLLIIAAFLCTSAHLTSAQRWESARLYTDGHYDSTRKHNVWVPFKWLKIPEGIKPYMTKTWIVPESRVWADDLIFQDDKSAGLHQDQVLQAARVECTDLCGEVDQSYRASFSLSLMSHKEFLWHNQLFKVLKIKLRRE